MRIPGRVGWDRSIGAGQIEVIARVAGSVALSRDSALFANGQMVRWDLQILLEEFGRFDQSGGEACFDVPFDVAVEEIDAWVSGQLAAVILERKRNLSGLSALYRRTT